MKSFSVNMASWHYRLNVRMAKTNERLSGRDNAEKFVRSKDNLCSYWQMTLWSMFKIGAAVTFILALVALILLCLYGIGYAFLFYTEEFLYAALTVIFLVAWVAAVFFAIDWAVFFAIDWAEKRKKRKLDAILNGGETETSLARAKYSSWKNGICLPVEFKE